MVVPTEFPKRPVPAVSAIVFRDSVVLLVKRGRDPNRGRWSPPGGVVEVGETVEDAAVRETIEETGVGVRPLHVLSVRDFIDPQGEEIRWHFVVLTVLCEYLRGEPFPASDAENARFIPLRELAEYDLAASVLDTIRLASRARGIA